MTLFNDSEVYTRYRYGAETVGTDGRKTRPTPTTSPLSSASVQPVDDSQIPDDLMREDVTHRIYTRTELRPIDEKNQLPADEVLITGERYRVVRVHYWRSLFGGQYRAFVSRVLE